MLEWKDESRGGRPRYHAQLGQIYLIVREWSPSYWKGFITAPHFSTEINIPKTARDDRDLSMAYVLSQALVILQPYADAYKAIVESQK